MPSLADTTLSEAERRTLERLVPLLESELGPALHGVWLYGSRARGEAPHPESDIDVLVVASGDEWALQKRISELVDAAAEPEGASPWAFSARVYTPERVAQRRNICSFFIQEVDRDKIVLFGEA